jgi:hypothetical protein
MVRSTVVIAVLLCVTAVFAARPARADGVNIVDEYNVSGLLTITGNDACPPAPACSETLSFSFLIGNAYDYLQGEPFAAYVLPDSGTVESLGPLGQFALARVGVPGIVTDMCGAGGDCNFINFYDQAGDEIDLHLAVGFSSAPIVPDIIAADLFECGSQDSTCAEDFFPGGLGGIFNFGEVETTVTPVATPEPSSLSLLGAGLLSLMLFACGPKWCRRLARGWPRKNARFRWDFRGIFPRKVGAASGFVPFLS